MPAREHFPANGEAVRRRKMRPLKDNRSACEGAKVRQDFLPEGLATQLSRGSPGSCVAVFSLELTADYSLANEARAGLTD